MTRAWDDVLAERRRQVEEEGFTHEHDDAEYGDVEDGENNDLAIAAASYAVGEKLPSWPWARVWWTPRSIRENLVRAGALILAAIELIDHKEEAQA